MNLRKTAAALGAGAAIALTLTACGSDGGDTTTPTTTTTAAEQTTGAADGAQDSALPPTPTVDELNTQLQTALDPAVPVEQKQDLVTGLEADPQLLQTLSDKIAAAKADGSLTDIAVVGPILPPNGDVLSVPFSANFNGQTNTGEATLIAVDGTWRLDGNFVCGLATVIGVQSPACPA
ncbi:hypothetical protein [Tomitella cavernea]|uniref:hypothetical protein n=1 Tax=Tomitella cavernea TaxID=1387982 RepID=UPI0019046051|nr:hypothetical protein [Tomitella cavernea]